MFCLLRLGLSIQLRLSFFSSCISIVTAGIIGVYIDPSFLSYEYSDTTQYTETPELDSVLNWIL